MMRLQGGIVAVAAAPATPAAPAAPAEAAAAVLVSGNMGLRFCLA